MEVQWTSDAEDSPSQTAIVDLTSALTASANHRAMLLSFLYQNDAGYFQKPLDSVGQRVLATLKAASVKYDALQVFQRLQNNGFLLSKS